MVNAQNLTIFFLGALSGFIFFLIFSYFKKKFFLNRNIELIEILKKLPENIYWKDKQGVTLGSNDMNARGVGLQCAADIIGKTDYDLCPKEEADILRANDLEVMTTGLAKIVEEPKILSNGNVKLYLSHKIPLRNQKNQVMGILGVSIDLTDIRKKEIDRLRFLENIIAAMPEHIYWKDKNGVILGSNDVNAIRAGLNCGADMIGKTDYDLFPQKEADELRVNDLAVMSTELAKIAEEHHVLEDGTLAFFLSHKIPLRANNGEITGILGVSFDITEKKRTEQALQETQAKLDGMTLLSATIAHELRTPIRAINSGVSGLKDNLPALLEGYNMAREAQIKVPYINPIHRKSLSMSFDVLESESQMAFTVIEMLLVRLNETAGRKQELTVCSIVNCVDEALKRYPFDFGELKKVHWEKVKNFLFKGNELLIVHVLFNLLKNALHHIKAVDKGEIHIWLTQQESKNQLHFKDTGRGIPADILPRVFDQFFSKTTHGTGIGLSFCKKVMHDFGGDITCDSVEGEYTEFVLNFPNDSTLTEQV